MQQYEQYKDSGIDWIGQIPAHWEVKALKHIKANAKNAFVDGPFGSNLKSEHFIENGEVYVIESGMITSGKFVSKKFKTISELHFELIRRSECTEGDIIIAKIGANFGMAAELPYLDRLSVISGNALKMTLNNNLVVNKYFSAMINVTKYNNGFLDIVNISAQPALSLGGLNNLKIPLPPLAEQTAIANFLDTKCEQIDRAVAQKEKVVELLNERRQILIQRAVTRGLNPDVELRDSGIDWIGQIPAHWEVSFMKHLLSGIQDGTHGTYERVKSDYFLLSAKNISDSGVDISDNESSISEYDYLSITSNGYPKSGDVLLCCVGTIGRCCLYNLDTPIAFQRSVAFLRPNDNTRDKYLLYILRSESLQIQYQLYSRTSAQSGIYLGVIKNFRVPLPPLAEQTAIAEYLDNVNEKIDRAIALKREEIEKLKEYKQTLINSAVTGKIKIA